MVQEASFGLAVPAARVSSGIVKVFRIELPDGVLVVDAATPAAGPMAARWLKQFPQEPRWIALTHAHIDHMGGLAALRRNFPRARVLVHPDDAETVEQGRFLVPRQIGPMTPAQPLLARFARLRRLPRVRPDGPLDELERWGVEIIPTPGHAFPHTALKLPGGAVLAGDSFTTRATGRPMVNNFGDDLLEMKRSIQVMARCGGSMIYPSHGPAVSGNEFEEFARKVLRSP